MSLFKTRKRAVKTGVKRGRVSTATRMKIKKSLAKAFSSGKTKSGKRIKK